MKRQYMLVSTLVALTAVTLSADSIGTIGGNVVAPRSFGDTDANFCYLDSNHPFTSDGNVTSWEIYAGANAFTR